MDAFQPTRVKGTKLPIGEYRWPVLLIYIATKDVHETQLNRGRLHFFFCLNSCLCSFSWICIKLWWAPDFVEFVLGRFSHFYIEIAYSNFTFCGAWTPSFCEFTWKLSKFQQNEHTPGNQFLDPLGDTHSTCLTRDFLLNLDVEHIMIE